jgi:SPP1 family predicted phage head-tail adaptor
MIKRRRPHRQVCLGDLDKRIKLHSRAIQPPQFQSLDLTERFEQTKEVWAKVITVTGKTIFAGINLDVALTHEIDIRYRDDVSSETWVEFEGNLLDIVATEDLEERHEFLRLACTARGDKDTASAQA